MTGTDSPEHSVSLPIRPAQGRPPKSKGIAGTRLGTVALGAAPAFILVVLFVGGSIAQAIRLSFSDWGGIGPVRWSGLDNYVTVLGDATTYASLWTTLVFAGLSSAGTIVIAALLAARVSAGVRGSTVYRVVWFLPGIAPAAAVSIFWASTFQPGSGALNVILGALGLGSDHAWLAQGSTALWPVIIVTVWASVGFAFLLLLGAMEQIPISVYEAAHVDGASPARQFFSLTLPLVRPVIIMAGMLEFIWNFNGFTIVWAMTRGGPGNSTAILPVLVYKQAFQFTQFGPATALAVVGGVILIALGLIGIRASQSRQ